MREILFRGKRIDNGEWVKGYLICPEFDKSRAYIGYLFPDDDHDIDVAEVASSTVGRFTGLTDRNGVKIFEGDIVNFYNDDGEYSPYEVRWRNSGFSVLMNGKPNLFDELDDFFRSRCEVIGNVFDNPELLEVNKR